MGFPLINANVVSWDDKNLTIKLSQSKFSVQGKTAQSDPWKIPIAYMSSNEKQAHKTVLMDKNEMTITIPNLPKDGWVKVNAGVVGFYQVQYQDELFTALKNNIGSLSVRDRVQVEADLYSCCKAGLAKSTQFLEVNIDSESSSPCRSICNGCCARCDTRYGYSRGSLYLYKNYFV